MAVAPYVTPTLGNSDSAQTIVTEAASAVSSQAPGWALEDILTMCIPYNVQMWTYEGGFQWNSANQSAVNVATACVSTSLSPTMQTPLTALWQQVYDFGVSRATHFAGGVWTAGGNNINDELSNNYSTLIGSGAPQLSALQAFTGGVTRTRNLVTASGSIVNGANYLDHITAGVYGNFALNQNAPHNEAGYCTYHVYCQLPGPYTLEVTFSSVSGSPTTSVEVNGTVLRSGVAVSNGVINLGAVTLLTGDNYICLGQNGAQGTTSQNQIMQVEFV